MQGCAAALPRLALSQLPRREGVFRSLAPNIHPYQESGVSPDLLHSMQSLVFCNVTFTYDLLCWFRICFEWKKICTVPDTEHLGRNFWSMLPCNNRCYEYIGSFYICDTHHLYVHYIIYTCIQIHTFFLYYTYKHVQMRTYMSKHNLIYILFVLRLIISISNCYMFLQHERQPFVIHRIQSSILKKDKMSKQG